MVSYRNGKATSIETSEKDVKVFTNSSGVCIKIKGTDIQLNDISCIGNLLVKFNIVSKLSKISKNNTKEDICDLLADNNKHFTAEYYKGSLLSLNIIDSNVRISKTSAGYGIHVGKGHIAAQDLSAIKTFLTKMDIITLKTKKRNGKSKNDIIEMPGVEQLTLNV